jgi:hypothetical protein
MDLGNIRSPYLQDGVCNLLGDSQLPEKAEDLTQFVTDLVHQGATLFFCRLVRDPLNDAGRLVA